MPIQGVPQGSPYSPILFILYVSDIPKPNTIDNKCKLSQFANDIAIWYSEFNKIKFYKKNYKIFRALH